MKTDLKGCSTCMPGQEQYEWSRQGKRTFIQYEYRSTTGSLFTCIAANLVIARQKKAQFIEAEYLEKK